MKNKIKSISAINILLVIQLILMLGLSIGITQLISRETTRSSDDYLMTITEERGSIIFNYTDTIKNTLSEYSHAGEILNAVQNPDDEQARAAAQKYTESFSKDIACLEGIYVSEWDTHVLAHTNSKVSGMTTRTGKSLDELHNFLLESEKDIYDAGIISSPASGKQVISMYKAVRDGEGTPVGIVGIGIYTDGLIDLIDNLSQRDEENLFYSMVDAEKREYIFSSNKDSIRPVKSFPELNLHCDILRSSSENSSGKFKYTSDGTDYVASYSYIGEKKWLFMISGTEENIYRLTNNMRTYLVLFMVFCVVLIVIFNIINKKQEDTSWRLSMAVEKNEKVKETLSNAVFRDILTDLKNRISFSEDFEEGRIKCDEGRVYYFAMFNIRRFSEINILYGEEAGDVVLVSASAVLKKCFPKSTVYRTGSDEFVVVAERSYGNDSKDVFFTELCRALKNLSMPVNIGDGSINVYYSVSAASKRNDINISVLPSLKSIMNMNEANGSSGSEIIDLDAMQ